MVPLDVKLIEFSGSYNVNFVILSLIRYVRACGDKILEPKQALAMLVWRGEVSLSSANFYSNRLPQSPSGNEIGLEE